MPQSLARIYLHIVFSTKNRARFITPEIEPQRHRYLGGLLSQHDCPPHAIGGVADHIHILCELGRSNTTAAIVADLKRASTLWIKRTFDNTAAFAWQNGYAAFSVSHSQTEDVRRYIHNQLAHHKKQTFEDEFRALLQKHQLPYDEKFLWD